ncbi:AMP-binding protein [Tistrella sp. BH-R2-4]|uniref:AMP-binding protein n=1 Tax=Tistrella arctica TaxID=3133430 RepID=A0ABU9YKT9_9PROT
MLTILAANARDHGDRPALRERALGIWQTYDWRDYRDRVAAIAAGLDALGFRRGDALAVLGDNRAALYFGSVAAMALGGFSSPVFPDVPPEELVHFTRIAQPRFALAEDQEQTDKLLALRATSGLPATIIYDDPRGIAGYDEPGLVALADLAARGRARLAAEPGLLDDIMGRAGADDIAVLLHSSGTTGAPKGIPIRHGQALAAAAAAAEGGCFRTGDEHIAYLPMAWVGDFVFSIAGAMAQRFVVNIPERQETVARDLREVAPTLYLAAPRAWDLMLTRVQVGMEESTAFKRAVYQRFMALATGMERDRLAGRRPGMMRRMLRAVGEPVIYGPIKDHLGLSRAARAYTGGEAIGEDTYVFFRALGIDLRQFYGQTESCALVVCQTGGEAMPHSVGRPLPGVAVRISAEGEVLISAGSVFSGYQGAAATGDDTLVDDDDGRRWLRTGDAGHLDPGGELVVLGRMGDVRHTTGGARFIAGHVENRLKFSPYIRNAAVFGDGRPHLAALICIDEAAVGQWAQRHGVTWTSYADLSQHPKVLDLVGEAVARTNGVLPEGERVRRFANLHKDFDADDGEITRTRKLRRGLIESRYGALIEALYGPGDATTLDIEITYETGARAMTSRRIMLREAR